MNRDIKFRAWEPLNEKMIYFDGFIPFQIGDRFIEGSLNSQNQEKKYLTTMNFDAIEVMEFSGLRDKNGKEMYEGDILHIEGRDIPQLLYFEDSAFQTDEFLLFDVKLLRTIKVVGNIYENSELLEGDIK